MLRSNWIDANGSNVLNKIRGGIHVVDLVRSKRSYILAKVIASLTRISVAANCTLEINLVAYV